MPIKVLNPDATRWQDIKSIFTCDDCGLTMPDQDFMEWWTLQQFKGGNTVILCPSCGEKRSWKNK